jgi:hypothetical protein
MKITKRKIALLYFVLVFGGVYWIFKYSDSVYKDKEF